MPQPGQWTGTKWICNDQPPDTAKVYYFCCPEGYRAISRKAVQARSTHYRDIKTSRMVCKADPDIMACGPKPSDNMACCPEVHRWIPVGQTCPMAEVTTGTDLEFLRNLQLPSHSAAQPNLTANLAIMGIPFIITIGIFLYFIFVK